jgi:hypothetical protein
MTWLVWRQHRQQALAAAIALVAVALFLVPTGRQLHAAFDDLGLEACLRGGQPELVAPEDDCGALSERFSGRFQGWPWPACCCCSCPSWPGCSGARRWSPARSSTAPTGWSGPRG